MEKTPQRTAQRLAILDYLKDNKSHPSVRDIYEHVSEKLSNISMTTVYNTLELLKLKGQVLELPIAIHGEGKRFDSNVTPHDHIICKVCNKVVDIELDSKHSLLLTENQQHGFDIKEISINVFGVCPECKSKDKESVTFN
jgi:Fur family transcriptional regulator, peroxide stress response regulator